MQARATSGEDAATLPQRRVTSESQGQNREDDASADVPVRSPVRCVSPEFVSAIAMNPGGRPKEVQHHRILNTWIVFFHFWKLWCIWSVFAVPALQRHMHSYREAFEEMDSGTVSPTPTVGGEVFPQTPAFPISPQTPYFNLCKFPLWLTEGFVELRLTVNSYKKGHSAVYQNLAKYYFSLLWM